MDDDKDFLESLVFMLKDIDAQILTAGSGKLALDIIKKENPHLILLDLKLPDACGIQVLLKSKEIHPEVSVVMITGQGSVNKAIESMKNKAYDFITKPFLKSDIISKVDSILKEIKSRGKNNSVNGDKNEKKELVTGISIAFKKTLENCLLVAKSDASILISGESGTGKEGLAQFIYENSNRKENSFHILNCAAIPENLIESELFGHTKGSFTGAYEDKKGVFKEAHKGTLFLDEIGELPLSLQSKMLRVLQNGEFTPIGGPSKKSDVRLLAATNKNLKEEVRRGRFREDLFFRLNVIEIKAPSLKERKEDINYLANYFLKLYASKNKKDNLVFSVESLEILNNYSWPGNIRELENVVEYAVVLSKKKVIEPNDLPHTLIPHTMLEILSKIENSMSWDEIERFVIQSRLDKNHGDKVKTAKELKISSRTIYRKLSNT